MKTTPPPSEHEEDETATTHGVVSAAAGPSTYLVPRRSLAAHAVRRPVIQMKATPPPSEDEEDELDQVVALCDTLNMGLLIHPLASERKKFHTETGHHN